MDMASDWLEAANGLQRDPQKASRLTEEGATINQIWAEQ